MLEPQECGKTRAKHYNTFMTALAKAQVQNTGINPQFLIDANGKPTAIMIAERNINNSTPMES
jgi:hypothetical protein